MLSDYLGRTVECLNAPNVVLSEVQILAISLVAREHDGAPGQRKTQPYISHAKF